MAGRARAPAGRGAAHQVAPPGAGRVVLRRAARAPPAPRRRAGGLQDVEEADFETSKGVRVVNSFDAMNLKDDLLRGIYQYGFEKPSAIQQRAILPIVQGRDVIAQAQSGTGKTSLIAITLLQMMDLNRKE